MEAVSDINAEGMKRFVKHLCLTSKRHEEREKARNNLDWQLKKVKQITLTQKPRKWLIEKELRELERKISTALEYERRLFGMSEADNSLIRQLKDRIFSLEYQLKQSEYMKEKEIEKNRELISDLGNTIADLREKIDILIEREERIKRLEKKVKKTKRRI